MNEKIKPYLTKAREILGKIPKKVMILVLVAALVIGAGAFVYVRSRPYSVLFTELSSSDMSAILALLEEQGVTDLKIRDNDTILVPESQVDALKAAVLQANYPTSGFGYDTYLSNVSALSTEAERNQAFLMDLQDRLGAVVACFDGVDMATVTINPGEDNTYVLDSGNVVEASAFVMVTMKDGRSLTQDQAAAIRNGVARSVAGLEIEQVTITDTMGNTYSDTSSMADSEASALKLQLEEQYSNIVRTKVMQALVAFFGEENVKVSVTCVVDLSYVVQNATDIILPEGSTNGQGIIGTVVYDHYANRDDGEAVGGMVGTEENSDVAVYLEPNLELNGNETSVGVSGEIQYNNPTTETYTERTAGVLTDCTISVSINSKEAGVLDLDAIRAHVARAAGINAVVTEEVTAEEYLESKISVLSMPFYEPEESDSIFPVEPDNTITLFGIEIPVWILYAAAAGLVLLLLLTLIIVLTIRSRRKRKLKKQAAALAAARGELSEELLAQLAREREELEKAGADMMAVHSERSMELRKDIRNFTDANPEIAAQMIKLWLRGGEENE